MLLGAFAAAAGFEHFASVAADVGDFFDEAAALLGAEAQDFVDEALAHEGVAAGAEAAVLEEFLDFAEADGASVEAEFGFAVAVDAALDFDFGGFDAEPGVCVVEAEADFGEAGWGALGGAGEDHVVESFDAEGAVCAFADHPAEGVHDVGFAGAVRSDDGGHAAVEAEFGAVAEGFVAADFDAAEAH